MSNRRAFLARGVALLPLALVRLDAQQPDGQGKSGAAAADTLIAPGTPGLVNAVGPLDNDPRVIGIERRLHCTCGCTLDVYTCRTTDFSCTFSPAMHRDVVEQVQAGATTDEILQAFVMKNGASVLMAPPPHGFALSGFLVPGFSVLALTLALVAWLLSRRTPAEAAVAVPAPPPPDAEQLQRLRRALDDVES